MEQTDILCTTTEVDVARTGGDWPDWELSRTRTFFTDVPRPIDTKGYLGQTRNRKLELVKTRTATGFTATWTFSCEFNIGPYRVVPNNVAEFQLIGAGTTYARQKLAGFGRTCGGWTALSWNGSFPADAFDAIDTFQIYAKDVELKRC